MKNLLMFKKIKKGFTLIELIVAFALMSILTTMLLSLFYYINSPFNKKINYNRQYCCGMEALKYIEDKINNSCENKEVTNNSIGITSDDKVNKYTINKYGKKLIIRYDTIYKEGNRYNIILNDIKDFQVKEKNNIIYISIVFKGDKIVERCMVLNE